MAVRLPETGAQRLETELLELLSRQGRRIPIPVFLIACILAVFVSDELPVTVWGSWLALVAVVLIVRLFVLGRLPDLPGFSLERRLQIAVVLSAVNGITHGLSAGFFPFIPELERAIQSMLIVALCTGAVATTAGYLPIFLAYLVPTLLPLSVLWAVSPGIASPGWVEFSVSVLLLMMMALLVALARDAFRLFRESFEIRQQQIALNRELKAALDQAEEAVQSKTRFLASASHDLRQPIHTLSLFSAALAMRPLDERSREIARHMDVALQSLASEFDAILDISKLDAGVVRAAGAAVDLRAVLERMREEFTPEAGLRGLELTVACPAGAYVETDEVLFERVLRNLLANAVKYTETGGISAAAAPDGDGWSVTVADTGPGIDAAEHARVFDEFYQIGNPERDRAMGLGLGLAIVKRLVDLLGIRLTMSSSSGEGTEFRLRLPPATPASVTAEAADEPVSALPDLQVLVVDDEVQVGLGMEALLTGLGCRVQVTDSTAGAVGEARARKPDIVLADLRLRGDDNGIRAVEAIREVYPGMPAILISGDIAPDRLREAEVAGIEMLHKPVVVDTLSRAVTRALG